MPDKESPIDACRSILRFMREAEGEGILKPEIREGLLEDLCAKCGQVGTTLRATFLAEGLYHSASERLRDLYDFNLFDSAKLAELPSHIRTYANIGFVTVIRAEHKALLYTLGRNSNDQDFISHEQFRYWSGSIRRSDSSLLSYVLTMVGEPRNVPCALAVQSLLSHYSVDLLVLVGIAAGPHKKVDLGDAIGIDAVYDYEHVRAEICGGESIEKPRPEWLRIEPKMRNDLAYFDGEGTNSNFKRLVGSVPADWIPPDVTRASLSPKYAKGTAAAGERLFADGYMDKMWQYDERIRAGDMEDSGFAQAASFYKVPWVIFRGIADFGDPHKDSKWHLIASLSASSAALAFLTQSYRLPISTL